MEALDLRDRMLGRRVRLGKELMYSMSVERRERLVVEVMMSRSLRRSA